MGNLDEKGYAKLYLEDKKLQDALVNLRKALYNKEEFIQRIKQLVLEE